MASTSKLCSSSQLGINLLFFLDSQSLVLSPSAGAQGTYITTPTTSARSLIATSADKFTSFSKTGQWGQALYGDLVAPSLQVCARVCVL